MRRKSDYCREYHNGNVTIKYDADAIERAARDDVLTISSILSDIDCYFIGDAYCLSNFDMGHTVYNYYSDLTYIFAWNDLYKLMEGRTIRLYARPVSDDDRELIESEGY